MECVSLHAGLITFMITPTSTSEVKAGAVSLSTARIAEMLLSQYRALLIMIRQAIEQCQDNIWDRSSDLNRTWQIAYHTLYFVHLYSCPKLEDFRPWSGQHGLTQNDDSIPGPPDPNSTLPHIPSPYSKEEVLTYWQFCWDQVDSVIGSLDLASESSGFTWYPIPKLEHQMVNLRHSAEHLGQLMERVRNVGGPGVEWRGSYRN